MSKMNRKQIPLCKECHIKVHAGKYDGPKLNLASLKSKS
jgi:hypothetical protein